MADTTLLSIRDEEIIATAKAHHLEFPAEHRAWILNRIRERLLTMPLTNSIAMVWAEHLELHGK